MSFSLKAAMCPSCGDIVDKATSLADDDTSGPGVGDLSICWNCGALNAFEDANQLRPALPSELAELPEKARNAIGLIKARGVRR